MRFDNQELKRVLPKAHRLLGRKVDVVGMDACLMTMLEAAYQLKDHAKVSVLDPVPLSRSGRVLRLSA